MPARTLGRILTAVSMTTSTLGVICMITGHRGLLLPIRALCPFSGLSVILPDSISVVRFASYFI